MFDQHLLGFFQDFKWVFKQPSPARGLSIVINFNEFSQAIFHWKVRDTLPKKNRTSLVKKNPGSTGSSRTPIINYFLLFLLYLVSEKVKTIWRKNWPFCLKWSRIESLIRAKASWNKSQTSPDFIEEQIENCLLNLAPTWLLF